VKPNIDAAGFGILRMGHFTTIGLTLVANVEMKVCRTIVLEDVYHTYSDSKKDVEVSLPLLALWCHF